MEKIEPQHNTLNKKALRWNISQFVWTLFLFVCYCLLFSQRVFTTWVMNSFFSILGILWSHAGVKGSELKVSSIGEIRSSWRNLFNRKLNRFLQRSRNAMTVNVIIYISNTVVKNSTKEGCYRQKLPLQPYSSTLIDMWLCQAVGWKRV